MSSSELVPISKENIDVWLVYYDKIVDESLLSRMRELLSPAERVQETRFHFPDDRKRYLVTRALVRSVLSRYANVVPADWQFIPNDYGRPRIANIGANLDGLDFNISHTRGLIALGISRHRPLGVDIEHVAVRNVSFEIADRFFSPQEVADLARVPVHGKQDRFFEYWTFKESYIKARGMGLSLPLHQFSFHFSVEGEVYLSLASSLGDIASRWNFWQMRPTPNYLMAVCASSAQTPTVLTVRECVPLQSEWTIFLPVLKRTPTPVFYETLNP